MQRTPGPLCGSNLGEGYIDPGTLNRAKNASPGPITAPRVDDTEQEVLLDLTQLTLDLVGILDPTPFSDGTNATISLSRGDWLGAGISGLSLIPYVGDLAKAGKLGRWAQTVEKAVALAKKNARFADRLRPILERLLSILDEIPSNLIPEKGVGAFHRLKDEIGSFVARFARPARAVVIENFLKVWYKYIDDLPLKSPGKDRGALWSKLGPKQPDDPGFILDGDHPMPGFALAKRLAAQDGRKTLETMLEPFEFDKKVALAGAQLSEWFGSFDVWAEFQAKLWERVSLKYVRSLEGRVTVYVDDKVLLNALKQGKSPILTKELQELIKRKDQGLGVTEIVVKDLFDGKIFEL